MSESPEFPSMSIEQATASLRDTLQHVCIARGRVEIRDGQHTGILISKEELDSLERALGILSNTADVQRMSRHIAMLTRAVADVPVVAGMDE